MAELELAEPGGSAEEAEVSEACKRGRWLLSRLAELDPADQDAVADLVTGAFEQYRKVVVCEVIAAVRADAHEKEAAGARRAAQERFVLIGTLRKRFEVSAGRWPSMRKRRRPQITLAQLYARDGGICQLGQHPITLAEATRDHIDPLGRGGKHKASNIQLACGPCNESKGCTADA